MSDYTPTTDEMRARQGSCQCEDCYEALSEWERWLAGVKAQAWDEGANRGFVNHGYYAAWVACLADNPYRQGENK
jgi:hypothetical protein